MYRLSADVDLAFLIGSDLLQACLGQNEAILNFTSERQISIFGTFAVAATGDAPVTYTDVCAGAPALLKLLRDSVAAATATAEGGLLLTFTSGATLEIFDDSDQYESFTITHKQHLIVV